MAHGAGRALPPGRACAVRRRGPHPGKGHGQTAQPDHGRRRSCPGPAGRHDDRHGRYVLHHGPCRRNARDIVSRLQETAAQGDAGHDPRRHHARRGRPRRAGRRGHRLRHDQQGETHGRRIDGLDRRFQEPSDHRRIAGPPRQDHGRAGDPNLGPARSRRRHDHRARHRHAQRFVAAGHHRRIRIVVRQGGPQGHRVDVGPERRRLGRHLRQQGRQRRHPHHHEEGPFGPLAGRVQRIRLGPAGDPLSRPARIGRLHEPLQRGVPQLGPAAPLQPELHRAFPQGRRSGALPRPRLGRLLLQARDPAQPLREAQRRYGPVGLHAVDGLPGAGRHPRRHGVRQV